VVSIHYGLSHRSRGLIGAADLARMKPTAALINTSRGPIVEEAALVDALKRNAIGCAGLDVYDREPLPTDHPFRSLDNVVTLPHLGYVTDLVYERFFTGTIEDIQGYLRGEYVRVLNPDVLTRLRPRP
jgi:D-3-phosphoglycerate dehydrogenase